MGMVGEACPGVDRLGPGVREDRDPRKEVLPIRVVLEDDAALHRPRTITWWRVSGASRRG